MNKEPLYIYLHLPKSAGYTFRYHLVKNLGDKELLLCYEFLGLDLFNPPLEPEIYKRSAFKYIKSLSKEKRDKIRIIHGHTVPYGIHELFDREARYFTFVRNPIDRTMSIYNHLSYLNGVEGYESRKHSYYATYLLINGMDPGFYTWLTKKYVSDTNFSHFSLVGYLKEFGYLTGKITRINISNTLNKFYFLGLSENFTRESLYFFEKLGMHKFFVDQNISVKHFAKTNNRNILKAIKLRNPYDWYIYHQAAFVNTEFKLNNSDFNRIVNIKSIERKILLPITQPVFAPRQTLLRLFKLTARGEPLVSDPIRFSKQKVGK